jgi:DNA-binding MarR family transcriptional regulator
MSSNQDDLDFEELLDSVRALYGAIDRFDQRLCQSIGIDRSSLKAINAMESGDVSPKHLSQVLGLTSGAVTALLDRLEDAGHVKRHFPKDDRRRRDASLSKKTRALAASHYEKLAKNIMQRFREHPSQKLRQTVQSLKALVDAFDNSKNEI